MFSGGGVEGAGSKGDARNIYLEHVLTGWKYFVFSGQKDLISKILKFSDHVTSLTFTRFVNS